MAWDWEKLQEQQKQRGGGPPPQVDEMLNKFKGSKIPNGIIIAIICIIVVGVALSTMFYRVEIDEVGVVQRFGKWARTTQPGLHIKLPAGIEKMTAVKVRKVNKEEFGFTTRTHKTRSIEVSGDANVALMLTGDLNVALVPWIVHYKIKDPYKYLFMVRDAKRLLRDMSESSMRMVVGDRSINEVINKRAEIADAAKLVLQEELDNAKSGIDIVTIEMKKTNVPEAVQPSFNEVNQAIQEKETMIYQAREDYNKAIPAARGEAERVLKVAEGYALDKVNRAKGDAVRFKALYTEYSKAKDVTKKRLYLEMLKEIYPKLGNKTIIDSDQKNILPLLNLGQGSGGAK